MLIISEHNHGFTHADTDYTAKPACHSLSMVPLPFPTSVITYASEQLCWHHNAQEL